MKRAGPVTHIAENPTFGSEYLKKRDDLGVLGVDGIIILKLFLQE
jgi:hypothetical protein